MTLPNDLEKELGYRSLRPAPRSWRAEILAACDRERLAAMRTAPVATAARRRINSSCLWPHPAAWTGLAALWVALFFVNQRHTVLPPGVSGVPLSAELLVRQREAQQQILEEFAAFVQRDKLPLTNPDILP